MTKLGFKIAIAAMMAFALSGLLVGCGPGATGTAASALESGPAVVANTTTLDEKAAITAETAYSAASLLGAKLADAGLIDRAKFRAADQAGYTALLAVRAAYKAGNAPGFGTAVLQLNAAVMDIKSIAKGSN